MKIISRQVVLEHPTEELHFPYLLEGEHGIWYLTYREGGHWVEGGDRVHCIMSDDRGKTWQEWPGLAPDPQQRQLFRTRLSNGNYISYRFHLEHAALKGSLVEAHAVILLSEDNGKTWNSRLAPIEGLPFSTLGSGFGGLWGPAVELDDRTIIWGFYGIALQGNDLSPDRYLSAVVKSEDGGKTFSYLAPLCLDAMIGERGPYEPNIVRLATGELYAVMRTGLGLNSPMAAARSLDGGKSWSKPVNLPRPGASPQLVLLNNGVLVLVFGTRENIHMMASWDGSGRSWSEPVLVYQGFTDGYTNVQTLSDNSFFFVHSESSFQGRIRPGNAQITRVDVSVERDD